MRALIPSRDLNDLQRILKHPPPQGGKDQVQLALEAPDRPSDLVGATLAPRELEVLRLMAGGRSYSHIADELGLRPETAKGYAKALRRKLGASSREDAVARARAAGLL